MYNRWSVRTAVEKTHDLTDGVSNYTAVNGKKGKENTELVPEAVARPIQLLYSSYIFAFLSLSQYHTCTLQCVCINIDIRSICTVLCFKYRAWSGFCGFTLSQPTNNFLYSHWAFLNSMLLQKKSEYARPAQAGGVIRVFLHISNLLPYSSLCYIEHKSSSIPCFPSRIDPLPHNDATLMIPLC